MIDGFEMFVLNERINFCFYFLFLQKHIAREVAIFFAVEVSDTTMFN
jgi:hypothetical protein